MQDDCFCLNHHLDKVYGRFPEGLSRPLIGITANHADINTGVRDRYWQQVIEAGGCPVLLPPSDNEDVIIESLNHIDGLLLTGGADHDPRWMGEQPSPQLGNVNAIRDLPELLITRLAHNRQIPILGICRGIQTMAIALGGHVVQDIASSQLVPLPRVGCEEKPEFCTHSQDEEREVKTHNIRIDRNSTLFNMYAHKGLVDESGNMMVNSFHHQAVDNPGPLFRATAWADDGVIEAMESTELKPMMGVQWHPEWLGKEGGVIFQWLVDEARIFHQARQLHQCYISVDSHCDTPMFFPQGADFSRRDDKILVDVHKMHDGRQDVTTMVAYIPQPQDGQTWADVAPFPTASPTDYAHLIFTKIEDIVNKHPEMMAIARSEKELWENKSRGCKSIMLGIENGLAIGTDLSLISDFQQKGIQYITLCHNGDNQICDSARKSNHTWGGVSPFGRKVIHEMNQQGVTVDLSHAAESSFYDAIEISQKPVVCSHSNCKALCHHERNLTDDQLRTLAKHGGVCQITLYEGFVTDNPSEADILHAIDHLNHAVRIMGIEHVGLGTDFDGDGGIRGIKDSSEYINFTRQLLKHHYSDDDIRLIMGANWLRVLEENKNY